MRRIIRVDTKSKQHKHEYEIRQTNKNTLIVEYKAEWLTRTWNIWQTLSHLTLSSNKLSPSIVRANGERWNCMQQLCGDYLWQDESGWCNPFQVSITCRSAVSAPTNIQETVCLNKNLNAVSSHEKHHPYVSLVYRSLGPVTQWEKECVCVGATNGMLC